MEQTHLYSSHHNVNLLTAALLAHNIRHVVVCPGSRNAPIVHNLQVNGDFSLYSVTDERSAAFVALGLWLKVRTGVALCVTSGSALLNTLPGVAEAALRNIPLVIISADRPQEFHGILDGQTLPQQGALLPYVRTWQVNECTLEEDRDCRATLNEAFRGFSTAVPQAIHLNVPISEPLFTFDVEQLPNFDCAVPQIDLKSNSDLLELWKTILVQAKCPVLVIGQVDDPKLLPVVNRLKEQHQLLVYAECLSQCHDHRAALWLDEHQEVVPDVVIHCGGCFVNKQFKLRLRKSAQLQVLRLDAADENLSANGCAQQCPDTFFKQPDWLRVSRPWKVLEELAEGLPQKEQVRHIYVQLPESTPLSLDCEALFVGNSRAVRVVNRHWPVVDFPIYGNRGTNGIEGSLSVAAGYAMASTGKVLCVLGDLSFFYDVNALWNRQLDGRLRILLLNNGRGDIFYALPGLSASPALPDYVAATHQTTARGIADSYHCIYHSATADNMEEALDLYTTALLALPADRPVLFEIFIS